MKKEVNVVYEDADVVVINKPSGLMVHNDGRSDEETVADWLLLHAPEAKGIGEEGFAQDGKELERSGVVHRLDKETSGILVLAKNQEAFVHLKEQFHDRHAKKEYRAFVYGKMKEKWGTIDRPIGRSAKDFRLRSAQRGAKGKLRDATTDWELIGQTKIHAYLKLIPKTGRTHQIRVHLKAINHPIVHDPLYAPVLMNKEENIGFERLALHAHKLTLVLPNGNEEMFIAPKPEDFEIAEVSLATG
jgi:23S rRNA pseudouridine1911/1915/1917 synthase